jgi:hypothetical protein
MGAFVSHATIRWRGSLLVSPVFFVGECENFITFDYAESRKFEQRRGDFLHSAEIGFCVLSSERGLVGSGKKENRIHGDSWRLGYDDWARSD